MKYVFICPQFIVDLYFCLHEGEGFKLSRQVEDAIVCTCPESAVKEVERLKRQSGFPVIARACLVSGAIQKVA